MWKLAIKDGGGSVLRRGIKGGHTTGIQVKDLVLLKNHYLSHKHDNKWIGPLSVSRSNYNGTTNVTPVVDKFIRYITSTQDNIASIKIGY